MSDNGRIHCHSLGKCPTCDHEEKYWHIEVVISQNQADQDEAENQVASELNKTNLEWDWK